MKHLSRRLFLEETLLAAAAATVVPALTRAAESTPQSKSPNERINIAVLGVHGRGKDHIKAYAGRNDCQVTHVCDPDTAVGEKVAAGIKGPAKFVQDLRRVFDDKSVDVVSIATPNHWHALAAIWAMQAGKDVYCEKPVSHNVSEGRRIVQASRKYNRICQGGTQHRSEGPNRAAAEYIRAGKIGQLKLVRVCTYRGRESIGPAGDYPVPSTVDYNLWAGPAPLQQPVRRKQFHYDWHWFWDYGGGELANNSIHGVDTARLISGLNGLGRAVLSYGGRVGLGDDAGETPSTQVAIHDFNGVTFIQEVRNLKTAAPRRGADLFVGSDGYVAGSTAYDKDGNVVQKLTGPGIDHFGNFLGAVRSRKREEQTADIEEGHQSTSVVHVANISQRLGKPTSAGDIQRALESLKVNDNVVEAFVEIRKHLADNGVDIDKTPLALGPSLTIDGERFTGANADAANAMLTRDYRKPFVVPTEAEL